VYVRQYDEREQRWTRAEPTYGGSAYKSDIVIVVPRERYFDPVLGYYDVPKVFIGARRNGYERSAIYLRRSATQPASDGESAEVKKVIWRYLDDLPRAEDRAGEGEAALEVDATENAGDGADAAEDEEGATDE
jgi:hypothetical protein